MLPTEAKRFAEIRRDLGLTQTEMATELGIPRTTTDIERGKSKITGEVVAKLYEKYQINPLYLYGKSDQKQIQPPTNLVPKIITVDDSGVENIVMVQTKAAAGYAENLSNPEYFENLPTFMIPLPKYRNSTYRAFQVEGDSMEPLLYEDDWLLCEAINSFEDLKHDQIAVIIEKESVRVKKIQRSEDGKHLILISENQNYPIAIVPISEVLEVWNVSSLLTDNIR